jgi:hypothetical protein
MEQEDAVFGTIAEVFTGEPTWEDVEMDWGIRE